MKFEVFIMYALKSIKVYKTLLNSSKTIRSHKNLVVIDSYCPIGIYFRVYIYISSLPHNLVWFSFIPQFVSEACLIEE